ARAVRPWARGARVTVAGATTPPVRPSLRRASRSMLDVVVIGGGPAGAALAARLADAGRAVAVLEKSAFQRAKVCGEFIAAPGVRLLQELRIAPQAEVRRIALWAGNASLEAPLASG